MSVTFFKKNDSGRHDHGSDVRVRAWSNQDIADFYRTVEILNKAGINTEVDSGITDEGDPWFVFIRPENGDVIAHFAYIDGVFIAVSSINQEIYRGKNIRSIVDQMLDRHPMLLPQSENGGRLFLHPTAALTAFLAAAFILTIDGVKASNIGDIISLVGSSSAEISNSSATFNQGDTRNDAFKGMFLDLNNANYNSAMLGAALIAHELSQNASSSDKPREVDWGISDIDGTEVVVNDVPGDYLVSVLGQQRDSRDGNAESNTFKGSNFHLNFEEASHSDDEGEVSHEKNEGVSTSDSPADFEFNNVSPENLPFIAEGFEMFWNSEFTALFSGYHITAAKDKITLGDEINSVNEVDFELMDSHSGSVIKYEVGNTQMSSKGDFSGSISGSSLDQDRLEFSLNSNEGDTLVSLQELDSLIENKVLDRILAPAKENAEPFFSSVMTDSELIISYSKEDLFKVSEFEPSEVASTITKPVLGHSVSTSGELLLSSDAVDIVFYQGGEVEISEFELGTDLLWFFLSSEEISTADNSIDDNGNMVIDFGDTGTLTLLNMVADTSFSSVL
jgi:hypothetical protein